MITLFFTRYLDRFILENKVQIFLNFDNIRSNCITFSLRTNFEKDRESFELQLHIHFSLSLSL